MFIGAPTRRSALHVLFASIPYHRLLCGSWFKGNILITHWEQVISNAIPIGMGPFPPPSS